MNNHDCTQREEIQALQKQTERQNRALFGNPDDPNDLGAIELIKEIHATQIKMIPTYNDLNNWAMFFKKGRELGGILVAVSLGGGVILGTIYAIKAWINEK